MEAYVKAIQSAANAAAVGAQQASSLFAPSGGAASSAPSSVMPAPPQASDAAPVHAPLSVAALANVERVAATSSGPPLLSAGRDLTQDASGGSEGSDAELTIGTAAASELLLLHTGGQPSCQPSPLITATAKPAEDCPEMLGAAPDVDSTELLLQAASKRPRL